jgi:hypothetical protein
MHPSIVSVLVSYAAEVVTSVITNGLDDTHVLDLKVAGDFQERMNNLMSNLQLLQDSIGPNDQLDKLVASLGEFFELVGEIIHVNGRILFRRSDGTIGPQSDGG